MPVKHRPVRVLRPSGLTVCIVGVGGTGSALLHQLARLVFALKTGYEARERTNTWQAAPKPPEILLIDGDRVEPENASRQFFHPSDEGRNKARVLAERFAAAYGIGVRAFPEYLTAETDLAEHVPDGSSIVVGSVDNTPTRRLLHEKLLSYGHVVYLDSGNGAVALPEDPEHLDRYELHRIRESGWAGQVLCGVRIEGRTVIPFPGEVIPGLIEVDEEDPRDRHPEEPNCAAATAASPQRHATNLFASTVVMGLLTPLVSEGTLVNWRAFFDARKCFVRSDPAVDALLEVAAT
jgi:hypothetical protein